MELFWICDFTPDKLTNWRWLAETYLESLLEFSQLLMTYQGKKDRNKNIYVILVNLSPLSVLYIFLATFFLTLILLEYFLRVLPCNPRFILGVNLMLPSRDSHRYKPVVFKPDLTVWLLKLSSSTILLVCSCLQPPFISWQYCTNKCEEFPCTGF